jgi:hypothetical protein
MKASSVVVFLSGVILSVTLSASAREMVLPAGTLLKCTLNEPNFSSSTAAVGDPVLCSLHSQMEFGQQVFPRGSYLVGHLESAKEPGHFWGKGDLKLQFDRIGLPSGDLPLDSKVIATRGYKLDREGDIRGKGHAKRDVVEWMIPPLWPWKIIMLPARGPRPTLKGETALTLRLMDDVQIPQVAQKYGPDWHFFGHTENESFRGALDNATPQLAVRTVPADDLAPPRLQEVSEDTEVVASPIPASARYALASTRITNAAPGVPVFVLKSGTMLQVGNYTYQSGRIAYELASGGTGVISTDEVDWSTTTRLNSDRGVRVTLRSGHPVSEGGF